MTAFVMAIIMVMFAVRVNTLAWNGSVAEVPPQEGAVEYLDAFGVKHRAMQDLLAKERQIDISKINHHVAFAEYVGDENYIARKGVDVSEWTGQIDWNQVKAGGYDFCFIRIGYTGNRGGQMLDRRAIQNIMNAKAAGMDVGVYFFSLAVNEVEAVQEAQFVINALGGLPLEMPVMYDPEHVRGQVTRNDNLSGAQFTANAVAFCNTIMAAGYEAGVYANMIFEMTLFDMKQIEKYHVWFADYEPRPQSPYAYEFWQYNGKGGNVPGIRGDRIDLNLQFIMTPKGYEREVKRQQFELTGVTVMDNGEIFDASYYATMYPEVVAELGSVSPTSLYKHYLKFGMWEGKYPSAQALANETARVQAAEAQALEVALWQLSLETGISIDELRESMNAQP